MQFAQRLYEGADIDGETVGLITYMRTDGVDLAARGDFKRAHPSSPSEFGDAYVPKAPRKYTVKAKNAQEAHEAIRPTDLARLPRRVARALDPDQAKLYELIWTRTIASQMESAELERTTVDILAEAGDAQARSARDRPGDPLRRLPEALSGRPRRRGGRGVRPPARRWRRTSADARRRSTRPSISPSRRRVSPRRRLVKRMEELGIGRPSTYASTLRSCASATMCGSTRSGFIPEDKGRLVTAFLESFFTRYVEYDFTADLEEKLDRVSDRRDRLEAGSARFLDGFLRSASAGPRICASTQVLDSLNEILGPHIFPPEARTASIRAPARPAATASSR